MPYVVKRRHSIFRNTVIISVVKLGQPKPNALQFGYLCIVQSCRFPLCIPCIKHPHAARPRTQLRLLLLRIGMPVHLLVFTKLVKYNLPLLIAVDLLHLFEPARYGGVPIDIDIVQEANALVSQWSILALCTVALVLTLDVEPAGELLILARNVAVTILLMKLFELSG